MDRLSEFIIDVDEWLDEYEEGDFLNGDIPTENAVSTREEVIGSEDSETEAEQSAVGS